MNTTPKTYRVVSKTKSGWIPRRRRFRSVAAAQTWAGENPLRGEIEFTILPHDQVVDITDD